MQLLSQTRLPECWAQAMAALPERQVDRSALQALTWPERLAALPVWTQLGLTEVSA